MVAKMTIASFGRRTMWPSITTIDIGMTVIAQVSSRFDNGVGFS